MSGARKVLPWLVLTVLVLAGGIFGLRSWVGTDAASDDSASPGVVSESVAPTPSAGASASPTTESTPSATPSATPTPTRTTAVPRTTSAPRRTTAAAPRTTRTTGAVVARIKASLDAKGRPTSVWCPPRVSAAVGTTFTCTVAYAAAPATVIADATVRITSREGQFTWRSSSRS